MEPAMTQSGPCYVTSLCEETAGSNLRFEHEERRLLRGRNKDHRSYADKEVYQAKGNMDMFVREDFDKVCP
jgi:hypothetical protein